MTLRGTRYRSPIALDARGLKSRTRKIVHPRACDAMFVEFAGFEVRPYTAGRIDELMRGQKGRKVKTVARHLYEGEGRRARALYERLGYRRFLWAWETYPRGIYLDFKSGDAFVDGDVVPINDVLTYSR